MLEQLVQAGELLLNKLRLVINGYGSYISEHARAELDKIHSEYTQVHAEAAGFLVGGDEPAQEVEHSQDTPAVPTATVEQVQVTAPAAEEQSENAAEVPKSEGEPSAPTA